MYFIPNSTVEQTRAQYRYLTEKYHPTNGGDPETIQIINASYHAALEALDGPEYHYDRAAEREIMAEIAADIERG